MISVAYAAGGTGGDTMGILMNLAPLILIFVVFYFLLIMPQQKKAKEHKALVEALAKGDEVITAGGMTGKITKVTDDFITVSIAENVEVQFQKSAISTVLPKGTLKNS